MYCFFSSSRIVSSPHRRSEKWLSTNESMSRSYSSSCSSPCWAWCPHNSIMSTTNATTTTPTTITTMHRTILVFAFSNFYFPYFLNMTITFFLWWHNIIFIRLYCLDRFSANRFGAKLHTAQQKKITRYKKNIKTVHKKINNIPFSFYHIITKTRSVYSTLSLCWILHDIIPSSRELGGTTVLQDKLCSVQKKWLPIAWPTPPLFHHHHSRKFGFLPMPEI